MTLLGVALVLQLAQAAPSAAPAPSAGQPAPRAARPGPSAAPEDLDLLPPEQPRDPKALAAAKEMEQRLAERRTLLRIHQVAGFAVLGSLGAAVVLGQLEYSDKYGGGGDSGKWHAPHQVAAYGAAGLFAAAGILALVAPQPFDRQQRVDTAVLHKTAMAVATAGMVAQIALGIATAHSEGTLSQPDLARVHLIIGYATFAATAAGFTVLTF